MRELCATLLYGLCLGLATAVSGCATVEVEPPVVSQPPQSGLISNTADHSPGNDLEAAWIYEIDGEPVPYTRPTYRLPEGEHMVKVWPVDTAPRGQVMVPDTLAIQRERIRVETITVDVQPGYRYFIAARTNITRTTATTQGIERHEFQPEKFVVPVLSRVVEPATVEEAVVGLSVFAGAMALGPLLGPLIFAP